MAVLETRMGTGVAAAAVRGRSLWRELLRTPSAVAGLFILSILGLACLIGPLISGQDPITQNLAETLLPASVAHPLGTDGLGRDELVRLLYGGRYSMLLGLAAAAIGIGIGLPLGSLSGFYGGRVDLVVQALNDVLLSFPGILLALALVAGLGVGLQNVTIAVAISSIPAFVRLARASALSIRELEYTRAAIAIGQTRARIVLRHVIPNSIAPIIVQASLQVGSAVLVAAGLGFLGLGVQPPTPEWGSMLGDSRNYIFRSPALSTFPGLAIFVVVIGFNLLGDGLRDVLDPRLTQ
jgi:ABC-type dipeptide/oligopeptide/nickel transport system permease subunit